VAIICGTHVTSEAGTGQVHTAPAHGADDYQIGKVYGLPVNNPVGDDGKFLGQHAGTVGRRRWPARRCGKPTRWCCRNSKPRAACSRARRSAQLPALLAPQDADHLPRDDAVVHRHGHTRTTKKAATLRWMAERAVDETQFFPAWGRARLEA
jgi:isoleucyl-tRNA synthetase